MSEQDLMLIDDLEIDALDDEALEGIAGGLFGSSSGPACCSCKQCSNAPPK